MKYPLGSFPRYPHQSRRAAERRERAIANSIAARRQKAHYYLRAEAAFYNHLIQFTNGLHATTPEGEQFIEQLNGRLLRIKTKLEQGHRVYFRKLGCLLRDVVVNADICQEIHNLSDKELADLAHNMAIDQLHKSSD